MSNNQAIQILRGESSKVVEHKDTLLEGQPVYHLDNNYINVGTWDVDNKVSPIGVREVYGKVEDNTDLCLTSADEKYDYRIFPFTNEARSGIQIESKNNDSVFFTRVVPDGVQFYQGTEDEPSNKIMELSSNKILSLDAKLITMGAMLNQGTESYSDAVFSDQRLQDISSTKNLIFREVTETIHELFTRSITPSSNKLTKLCTLEPLKLTVNSILHAKSELKSKMLTIETDDPEFNDHGELTYFDWKINDRKIAFTSMYNDVPNNTWNTCKFDFINVHPQYKNADTYARNDVLVTMFGDSADAEDVPPLSLRVVKAQNQKSFEISTYGNGLVAKSFLDNSQIDLYRPFYMQNTGTILKAGSNENPSFFIDIDNSTLDSSINTTHITSMSSTATNSEIKNLLEVKNVKCTNSVETSNLTSTLVDSTNINAENIDAENINTNNIQSSNLQSQGGTIQQLQVASINAGSVNTSRLQIDDGQIVYDSELQGLLATRPIYMYRDIDEYVTTTTPSLFKITVLFHTNQEHQLGIYTFYSESLCEFTDQELGTKQKITLRDDNKIVYKSGVYGDTDNKVFSTKIDVLADWISRYVPQVYVSLYQGDLAKQQYLDFESSYSVLPQSCLFINRDGAITTRIPVIIRTNDNPLMDNTLYIIPTTQKQEGFLDTQQLNKVTGFYIRAEQMM